jgi:hypothetical protein
MILINEIEYLKQTMLLHIVEGISPQLSYILLFVYWVNLTRSLQTEFEIMLQTMLKLKINSLFIRHIASFVEIYIHRYRFIPLCVYKNMQRTLNSPEKTIVYSTKKLNLGI